VSPAPQPAGTRRVRCAVLGSPIQHSLSPALHQAAYQRLGLEDWTYLRVEVNAEQLPRFVADRDASWRGLSLTMPLKTVALGLGEVDPLAARVGAANTIIFADDGRRVHNTDVPGLVAALQRAGLAHADRVTILGAGATARSALVSASLLGASHVTLVVRDPARGELLRPLAAAEGVSLAVSPWPAELLPTDLLISTVTRGAADDRADELVAAAPVIFDAVYDPWPTALAAAAERAGRVAVSGLDLLVGQAVLQIELMTGRTVEPEVLLTAGRAALSAAAAR